MTTTQTSTSKKKPALEKKADQSSDKTEITIAEYQLAQLQKRGLCGELPTELSQVLAVPLAKHIGLDHTVGNVRMFIVVDTREQAE